MASPETRREQPPEFTYREATPADAAAIARMQYDSWIATYPNESAEKENERITVDDVRIFLRTLEEREERWKRKIEKEEKNIQILVAEDAGKVIGFCKVEKKDGEEDNHLDALYLDLAYQGKGVAKNLMERAFAFLGNEKGMELEVASYNAHAKSVYEHYGFAESGTMDYPELINGKIMPLTIMRRPATQE